MSNHLPECPFPKHYWRACCCPELRACEARAEDEWLDRYNAAEQRGYDAGFRNGVAAARDAVADCRVPWPTATGVLVNEGIDDALAAIDALNK